MSPRNNQKLKKIALILIVLTIFYFTIKAKSYDHNTFIYLDNVPSHVAWEFVADFSNMKYLNPTIVDFNILDESGNYNHWTYTTEYSEFLSHWPYLHNHAVAQFNVKKSDDNSYVIRSVHRTCLFLGLYCLDSHSEFKFSENTSFKGTLCEERIMYQCPAVMSSFCRREVVYQRNAIINNLKKHFRNYRLKL